MNLLFALVFVLWVGAEMVLSSRMRASRSEAGDRDRRTLSVIWFVTVSSIFIAALISWMTDFPIVPNANFRYVGIGIMLIGMVLRAASIVTLGRMFTYNVAIREGHTLMTSRLYRFVRHPSYTGFLITFIGYGLALNNWFGIAIACLPVFIVFARRISIEEAALAQQFGDEYDRYKSRTWRLLPWII